MISGKKLRIAGKGEPSDYGGPPGDLFIQAKVLEDPEFQAESYDLSMTREIKVSEAILGTQINILTLDGKELNLKIPPGTKHKTKMRIPGQGLPHMRGSGRGDLFIHVHISTPKKLTDKQRKLVEKLAAAGL